MAAVNKPTDVKLKEADINRKLQIFGIVSAFQQGKVPSNDQIDVALNSFMQSKPIANPSSKLSGEGRSLVTDFKDMVEQSKLLLLSKNEGNLLQDFIWQTQQFDPKAVSTPGAPVNKADAKQHGDKALQGLRTLGTLIITNGQFRKLLKDSTTLLRDVAGDAATNAASKVKPSEDDLAQIDKPADDNTWHDAPDFSKDKMKTHLDKVYKKSDAKDAAATTADAAQRPDGSLDTSAASKTIADQVKARIPGDTQEAIKKRADEYRARMKDYLGKKVPKERRDQTVWRLKKMILECQQHPDYQQAVSTLLDLAELYGTHGRTMTQGGTGIVKDARSSLAAAEADLKTLIERFANGTSSDDLWDSIKAIYAAAEKDPELKDWFKSVDKYIRRCLQEQGYIMEDASNHEWDRLYERGNYLLREKYKADTDKVVDEIKFMADQFDQDSQNKAFAASVEKMFQNLGNDVNGKPTFKPHLVKDLTEVIIPALFENIAYVPIPRIEYADPQVDLVVENLVLESDNFMPNVLEIASDNYWRWGRKKIANKNKNSIDVKVTGIQMDLRDVSFYIKRKQGFPSLTDTGVVNVMLGGDGFCFRMKLSTADEKDKHHFFKVDKVDVDVKHLQIKLVKSGHKLLFALFKPMLLKALRPIVQKVAEKQIKEQFAQLDQTLYKIKLEADKALEEAKGSPERTPNIYNRYVSAVKKYVMDNKKKAEETAADKKVNMAITKEDSIFPNIQLPGGISSKATEYKELARKGEKWESPVFSIGSASKSSTIPSAPIVARKPHVNPSASATNGHGTATNGSYSVQKTTIDGAVPITNGNTVTI